MVTFTTPARDGGTLILAAEANVAPMMIAPSKAAASQRAARHFELPERLLDGNQRPFMWSPLQGRSTR